MYKKIGIISFLCSIDVILGETNSGSDTYNCTFPVMIEDWRLTFHERTNTTDPVFPFGFVQVFFYCFPLVSFNYLCSVTF